MRDSQTQDYTNDCQKSRESHSGKGERLIAENWLDDDGTAVAGILGTYKYGENLGTPRQLSKSGPIMRFYGASALILLLGCFCAVQGVHQFIDKGHGTDGSKLFCELIRASSLLFRVSLQLVS